MAGFDELLQNLHTNATLQDIDGIDIPIIITSKRTFEVPKEYNTVLGYAGDVNSQIVTFTLPRFHEGHDLSLCSNQKIKWKNLTSGIEGTTTLSQPNVEEKFWTAAWEVPAEAMTHAGKLEVAISLYDVNNSTLAFAWNTATYNGFSIGETFVEVGSYWDGGKLPAKNEILTVNVDTRTIIMPKNYNTVVANYGDIGISKVFFQIPRYIRGFDVSSNETEVYITMAFGDEVSEDIPLNERKPMFNSEDNYLLCWDIPTNITCNDKEKVGNFSISIKLQKTEKNEIKQRWTTATFTKLVLGPSLVTQDINKFASREEEVVATIIDNYLENRDFVIDTEYGIEE